MGRPIAPGRPAWPKGPIKWGRVWEQWTGAKLNKIYTKFIFLGVFPDESTVEVVYSFPAPLHCVTPPSAPLLAGFKTGLKARGKLARDDSLLRYVADFLMRWEYKETERICRSRGALGAREQQSVRPGCEPINEFAESKKVPT